jgi:hypothetical protein
VKPMGVLRVGRVNRSDGGPKHYVDQEQQDIVKTH